jgi:hypothetical protein
MRRRHAVDGGSMPSSGYVASAAATRFGWRCCAPPASTPPIACRSIACAALTRCWRADDDVHTNHIHADDLARIACLALFRALPGRAYNASDDSGLRMGDYFDAGRRAFRPAAAAAHGARADRGNAVAAHAVLHERIAPSSTTAGMKRELRLKPAAIRRWPTACAPRCRPAERSHCRPQVLFDRTWSPSCRMLTLKAFHIVFVVSWFAGLFYLPRLFVNHAMVEDAATRERLLLMSR